MAKSSPAPIRVTLLGTGTPQPSFERFASATLVQAGGLDLLFDAGRGASLRLTQAGLSLGQIDAVFFTHYHSDHTAGFPDIYTSGYIPAPFGGRQEALHIYGPPGIDEFAEGIMLAFRGDVRERAIKELPIEATKLVAHEIAEGPVFERNGVKVTAFGTWHHGFAPTYGFRIEYGPHSVVLSGDTAADPRVADAAVGCDLLVHEVAAIHPSMADNAFFRDVVMKGHTTPEEAAEIFNKAKPKLCVFTHIGQLPGGTLGPSVQSILDRCTSLYDGTVIEGRDLMILDVDAKGVHVADPGNKAGGAANAGAGTEQEKKQPVSIEFNKLPDKPRPYGIRCGQGPRYRLGGLVASLYATGVQTEDSFGLMMLTGGEDAGLPMMRHTSSHAGLYVTDGVVELTVGGRTYAMVKGDYASIPAGTPYGLRMDRIRNVAMLFLTGGVAANFVKALGAPYEGFVQPEAGPGTWRDVPSGPIDGCDTEILGGLPDVPHMSDGVGALPEGTEPFMIRAGEGDHYVVADQLFVYNSRSKNTNGEFFTLINEGPAGQMIPPHKHLQHDEMFFCVDGELKMLAGDEFVTLFPGDFMFVRRDTPHAYQFVHPGYTRTMGWLKPPIYETFFETLGDATESEVYFQTPPEFRIDRVMAKMSEFDIIPLGGGS